VNKGNCAYFPADGRNLNLTTMFFVLARKFYEYLYFVKNSKLSIIKQFISNI